MYSFKYSQQAAMFYNILYYCQCSTRFRWFFHPSSGAQEGLQQVWHIPDAVCTVLELLMMGGKTAQNI
jgi:hypothetical protein